MLQYRDCGHNGSVHTFPIITHFSKRMPVSKRWSLSEVQKWQKGVGEEQSKDRQLVEESDRLIGRQAEGVERAGEMKKDARFAHSLDTPFIESASMGWFMRS